MTWWVLSLLYNSRAWTTLYTLAWTNREAHLFMAWANYKPARHKVYKNVRGAMIHCGYRWIWDTPNLTEQSEPGDTYTHTFRLAALGPPDHIWYYLFSPAPDLTRECQGPLIHIEPPEIPMPSARLTHSVNQLAPNHNITEVTFDTELWDDGDFHSGANPERLTAPLRGLYAVGASLMLTTFANASWWVAIRKTPGTLIVNHAHLIGDTGWGGAFISLQTLIDLDIGDFLTVEFYHNYVNDKEIVAYAASSPIFWLAYLGPNPT